MFVPLSAVNADPSPATDVAANAPVLLLKVKLVPDLGPKSPVAAVANNGKQVVSVLSSATVTVVAIAAVPLVSWLSVATLAAATVPDAIFVPFNAVIADPAPASVAPITAPPVSILPPLMLPVVVTLAALVVGINMSKFVPFD